MSERVYKALHEQNALQRYLARRFLFGLFQRLGFHITGNHFYEIIPDTRLVAAGYSHGPRQLTGIDFRFSECERRALRLLEAYGSEYAVASVKYGFREKNDYFRGLDALWLYLVLRDLKPRKLVEIGQGFSTRISLSALERNAQETGQSVEFISIDPYTRLSGTDVPASVNFQTVRQTLQAVEMEPILEGCRFLFVDSSHVYKFGSDVEYEFTRLYPNLPAQSLVHVHDVFSPYDYPLDWIAAEKRFWNEQYVLENFLMFNSAFDVYLPVNMLARQSSALAKAVKRLTLDQRFKFKGQSFYFLRR